MPRFVLKFLVGALGLWLASEIIGGFRIDGPGTLALAAILLGLVNAVVRPVLIILTLPVTLLTLGLFLLVINGITVGLVSWLVPGMAVDGLWHALLAAVVIGVTSWVLEGLLGIKKRD